MRFVFAAGLLALAVPAAHAQAPLPTPSPDMATVVFYRPPMLARAAVNFTIRANGAELCRLSNKRYFVVQLKPGPTAFTSVAGGVNIPSKDAFDLKLEANKVYYVQGDVKVQFMTDKLVFTEVTESAFDKKRAELKPDNCAAAQPGAAPASPEAPATKP